MKKIALMLIILLVCGCMSAPICNKPYILVGDSCCLDVNDNRICDYDEAATTTLKQATTTTLAATSDAAATVSSGSSLPGFLLFESQAVGVRMNYPEDWGRIDDYMGTVVMFISPLESSSDNFRENINIAVSDVPVERRFFTLEEELDFNLDISESFFSDYRVVSKEKISVGGFPAYRITSTYTQGEYNLKLQQVLLVKNGREYVVTYGGTIDGYPRFLAKAQQAIDTFEVIG